MHWDQLVAEPAPLHLIETFSTLEHSKIRCVNNILCSSNIFLAYNMSPLFPFVSSWLHPLPLIEMFSTLKHLQTSKWQCNENIDIWESWHEHLKTKWQYMYSDIYFNFYHFQSTVMCLLAKVGASLKSLQIIWSTPPCSSSSLSFQHF